MTSGGIFQQREPAEVRPYVLYGGQKLDLNSATAEELEALPGIGPNLSVRIVAYRDALGGFRRLEELLGIRGIGWETLEKIRPYLSITRSSP